MPHAPNLLAPIPLMSDSTPSNDLSPWAHPKAQRWFEDLLERDLLPTALDDEIVQAVRGHEHEKVRVILALLLVLGRDGIWPTSRSNVLKSAVRGAEHLVKTPAPIQGKKPLTLSEARGRTTQFETLQVEIEMMRRRLKMSNRKTPLDAPKSWGNLWE